RYSQVPEAGMQELTIRTTDGGETTLSTSELNTFVSGLKGSVTTQADPDYEKVRPVWNATAERMRAQFAHCVSEQDVQRTIRLVRERGLLLGVRGGGHNIAGNALANGGVVIDFSAQRGVEVDADKRHARVQPGALLQDVDRETQRYGLATPLGINSTTGVAGLTLGGGIGWLSRRFGLTVDNLHSVRMVTADGDAVRASENVNAELFWAIRGGGGNFGVVTSFDFRLHPVGPEVVAGLIVHPADDIAALLQQYRAVAEACPADRAVSVVVREALGLPFRGESVQGQVVGLLALCYSAGPGAAEAALAPFRASREPHAGGVAPAKFGDLQQMFDPRLRRG